MKSFWELATTTVTLLLIRIWIHYLGDDFIDPAFTWQSIGAAVLIMIIVEFYRATIDTINDHYE